MTSLALLVLRLTVGGLLAGHGAQKLFGWFGGHGIEGTEGWLASMGMRPARQWALGAGFSEFFGGVLTAIGFLNPIGPILAIGAMVMASVKVHLGRPIWVSEGGAELPVTNIAAASALILAGPGALSADALLGVRVPRRIVIPAMVGIAAAVAYAQQPEQSADEATETEAGLELQAGGGTDTTTIQADPEPVAVG